MTSEELRRWIAPRVRQLRGNDSVAKFAKLTGVSEGTIHSTEHALQAIALENLELILRARGVTLPQFFAPLATAEDKERIKENRELHKQMDLALVSPDNRATIAVVLKSLVAEDGKTNAKRKSAKPSSESKTRV